MLRIIRILLVVSCYLMACQPAQEAEAPSPTQPSTISFTTVDRILITGERYHVDTNAASILLFIKGVPTHGASIMILLHDFSSRVTMC